jgi:hypothetical protein
VHCKKSLINQSSLRSVCQVVDLEYQTIINNIYRIKIRPGRWSGAAFAMTALSSSLHVALMVDRSPEGSYAITAAFLLPGDWFSLMGVESSNMGLVAFSVTEY